MENCDGRTVLERLSQIPILARLAIAFGGFLVSAFAGRLPELLQDVGLIAGIGIAIGGLIAALLPVGRGQHFGSSLADMPIRQVFLHIDPKVLDGPKVGFEDRWEVVGRSLLDNLSLGKLKSWGRMADLGREMPLTEIPSDYWKSAEWSYWFFGESDEQNCHTILRKGAVGSEYRDVMLSHREVFELWPEYTDSFLSRWWPMLVPTDGVIGVSAEGR